MLIGAVSVGGVRLSERSQRSIPESEPPALPPGVGDVLAVLRSSGIVVDSADQVVKASPAAVVYGLVRDSELAHAELRHLARQVRRDGVIREAELDLARGPLGRGRITVAARVAPLGSAHVLLLVDDRTNARRVEEVRRDFVANVSHELKTPVGGMALLAEAVLDANDDPEAVRRFARRMQVESVRLTKLVQEIVDLSRLQVADTAARAGARRRLARRVRRGRREPARRRGALDRAGRLADRRRQGLRRPRAAHHRDPQPGRQRGQLLRRRHQGRRRRPVRGRPGRGGRQRPGPGIPEAEQGRIFERFYRVDPARSRATGGTGLGLAIVKHICANHGGEVTVWSEEGRGSTFTMRLPAAPSSGPPSHLPAAAAASPVPPRGNVDVREATR